MLTKDMAREVQENEIIQIRNKLIDLAEKLCKECKFRPECEEKWYDCECKANWCFLVKGREFCVDYDTDTDFVEFEVIGAYQIPKQERGEFLRKKREQYGMCWLIDANSDLVWDIDSNLEWADLVGLKCLFVED